MINYKSSKVSVFRVASSVAGVPTMMGMKGEGDVKGTNILIPD